MILILSEENDHSTNDVIDWLLLWKYDFLRINESDVISIKEIKINQRGYNIFFKINESVETYSIQQFTSYWYRRGDIVLKLTESDNINEISLKINTYLNKENYKLKQFFVRELDNIPNRIGSLLNINNNKLSNLVLASQMGLKIPNTEILTEKKQIEKIVRQKYISKAIYNNINIFKQDYSISSYTNIINKNIVIKDSAFCPSLVQEFVDKQIDIRVFYLRKKIWTAAIFSQNDSKTKTDYRDYNNEKPNRIEPINLPSSIKLKIINFMTKLNLDSGSLDFALSKNSEYYFFEVNPVGQFGSISFSCGFNIEKAIAKELIKGEII